MTQSEMEEQVRLERIQYENLLKWVERLAQEESPQLAQEDRKFLIRFYKNKRGFWLPANKTEKTNAQIDIYEYEDGYLYYIHDIYIGVNELAFARDLFYDFNKTTDKYGYTCLQSGANFRLRANLNGYYWSISKYGEDIYKCEYFQSRHGTRYGLPSNDVDYNMKLSDTYFNYLKGVYKAVAGTLKKTRDGRVYCKLIDSAEKKESIDEELMAQLLADVMETNPADLDDMKKAFGR